MYNNNLLRLIYSQRKCGLSEQQIFSVLLGMGIVEDVAKQHLEHYLEIEKSGENPMSDKDLALNTGFQIPPVENNINKTNENNNMRKFNLVQLYENLSQTAKELHELSTVKTNASYSAISAYSIIENAMSQFPGEVNLMIGRKNAGLPVDESKISPNTKYAIAESVYNMLNGSFLTPCKTLCAYISSTMEDDKWGYVGAKMMNECAKKSSNNMYAALYEQISNALLSDNIYESLKNAVVSSEFWCTESKQVVALMESEQFVEKKKINNTVAKNNNFTMVDLFSPVIFENNAATFNLYGKNYTISEGKLMETHVKDSRYNDVVNGLSLMSYNPKKAALEYYGVNGSTLEYRLNEEKIYVNNNDVTNLASIDLRDNLSISGLFNKSNAADINVLVKMFESRDMIAKLDQCSNLHSDINPAIFLTLIAVEEGFYVNTVDYNNLINEMKFFNSANAAKNYIKERVDYDATNLMLEALKAEGNKKAAIIEQRSEIQERIDFLKEKRNEVISKIEALPENIDNKALTDALNLLESEIQTNETELSDTYTNGCGSNCVPVKVANIVGTLIPGDTVYVDAADFTAAPDYSTITVTDPKTGSSIVVNKTDLIFDINHNNGESEKLSKKPIAKTCTCEDGVCTCEDSEPEPGIVVNNKDEVLINDCNIK